MNRYIVLILVEIIVCLATVSCKPSGLYIVPYKKMEQKEYRLKVADKKERQELDKLYKSFFRFRKDRVVKIIKKKKLKDYTLEEGFYFKSYSGILAYGCIVVTKDSIFRFSKDFYSEKFKAEAYKPDKGVLFYIYRGDSLLVSSSLKLVDYNKDSQRQYISNFSKG